MYVCSRSYRYMHTSICSACMQYFSITMYVCMYVYIDLLTCVSTNLMGETLGKLSRGLDTYTYRQPLGVTAGNGPRYCMYGCMYVCVWKYFYILMTFVYNCVCMYMYVCIV
jgi:hypothetical protein